MNDLLVGEPHFVEWNSASSAFGGGVATATAAVAADIVFVSIFVACLIK